MPYQSLRGMDGAITDRMILRLPDGAFIPNDPGNCDWQAFLAWKAGGNTPADPPSISPPASTVTGNQWAFALRDLKLADAWEGAVTKSKTSDRLRWNLISRDTPLSATDPLLARIAGNAGADAAGKPVIDPAKVVAQALTEPL